MTDVSEEHDVIEVHKGCSNHRERVLAAERCGCFYCCSEFEPSAITNWVDPPSDDMQSGNTALCPKCGIDAVIPLEAVEVELPLAELYARVAFDREGGDEESH